MLLLSGGCAVKQPPAPADALNSVLPASAMPADWRAPGGTAGTVVTDWIQTFGDPQLNALVDEALQNNLDLKVASHRIEVAAALVTQARSLLYPHLVVSGGAGTVGRDWVKDRSGIVGDVSWELDLWGRVRAQGAAAEADRVAAEADLVFARQSLAATVATMWYDTIATERLRQTAQDSTQVYDELLRLVNTRLVVGRSGKQDVALALADLDRARRQERAYAMSEQHMMRGLEVILGRYPAGDMALAADLPRVPPPVPDGLPAELLERRPDLVAAERRVAAAFHAIQVAQAARLPRIALTGGGGHSTSELLRLAEVGAGFWRFGVELLAPIFTGGQLEAQVRLATAEQQAALAAYGQAALRAFSEVEASLAGEQLLDDQQRYLEAVLTQDAEALRLGRVRFTAGASDLFHVLQLQNRQLHTRFELIGVRNDRLANRVALHLALGGGFTPAPNP